MRHDGALEVVREIGRGSRSQVAEVRWPASPLGVAALKRLHSAESASARRALHREANVLAQLGGRGFPRLFATGEGADGPHLIMERLPGGSLAQRLAAPLPAAEVRRLGLALAAALGELHALGLVHRDVKPANVLFDEHGPRLTDLDLCTLSGGAAMTGLAGTPLYAAPEQTGGLAVPVDARADLYSLGVVLYECLAGVPPFRAATSAELLRLHAIAAPPALPAQVPGELGEIVMRLLAKDPASRFPSSAALIAALGGAAPSPKPLVLRDSVRDASAAIVDAVARAGAVGTVHAVVAGKGQGATFTLDVVQRRLAALEVPTLELHGGGGAPLAPLAEALQALLAHPRVVGAARDEVTALRRTVAGSGLRAGLVDAGLESSRAVFEGLGVAIAGLGRALGRLAILVDRVDDLDDATRGVVAALERAAAQEPVHVVMASLGPLASVPASARYLVGALTGDEVERLVGHALGAPASAAIIGLLAGHAAGNASALTALTAALVDGGLLRFTGQEWDADPDALTGMALPGDLGALLLRRLERLAVDERDVLEVAALCPTELDVELLAVVLAQPAAEVTRALGRAVEAGVVAVTPGRGLRFIHPSLAGALAARLEPSIAAGRHAAFVRALEARGTDDGTRLFELAHHASGAGGALPGPHRAKILVAAAVAAAARRDDATAERLFAQAEAADPSAIARDAAALTRLGEVRYRLKHYDAALGAFEAAFAVSREPEARALLKSFVARTHLQRFAWREARAALSAAFVEAHLPEPRGTTGELARLVAQYLASRRFARVSDDPAAQRLQTLALHLYNLELYVTYFHFENDRTTSSTLEVARRVPLCPPSYESVRAHGNVAYIMASLGRFDDARQSFARARAQADELGELAAVGLAESMRAWALEAYGAPGEALALQREVIRRYLVLLPSAELRNTVLLHAWNLAVLGRVDEIDPCLEHLRAHDRTIGIADPEIPVYEILAAGLAGDEAGLAHVDRQIAEATALGPYIEYQLLMAVVMARALLGQHDAAQVARLRGLVKRLKDLPIYERLALVAIAYALSEALWQRPGDAVLRRELGEAVAVAERQVKGGVLLAHVVALRARRALQVHDGKGLDQELVALDEQAARHDAPWLEAEAEFIRFARLRQRGVSGDALERAAQRAAAVAAGHGLGSYLRRYGVHAPAAMLESRALARSVGASARMTRGDLGSLRLSRHLDALRRLSVAVSRVLDPDEHARVATAEILRIMGGDRAFLFLVDAQGELRFAVGRAADGGAIEAPTGFSTTVVRRVARERRAIVVAGTDDAEVLGAASVIAHDLRSVIAAPVLVRDGLSGVLYVDSRAAAGVFGDEEVGMLEAVAVQIGTGLEVARAATIERERAELARDLALSAAVQRLLLPAVSEVALPSFRLASFHRSASQSGGDWWWYERLDADRMLLILGDVTGHGAGAAMVSATIAGTYHALRSVGRGNDIPGLLAAFDDVLRTVCGGEYLATVSMLLLDSRAGRGTWWCAAAPPIMIQRPQGDVTVLTGRSSPLGDSPSGEPGASLPSSSEFEFPAGTRALVFSDGVVERAGATRRGWGLRALRAEVQAARDLDAAALRDRLVEAAELSAAGAEDDVTVVIVDATAAPAGRPSA